MPSCYTFLLKKKRAPAIQPSFNIRVVSEPPDGPRILEIENFVSAADAETLVRTPKLLARDRSRRVMHGLHIDHEIVRCANFSGTILRSVHS